ncbi:MAG: anhydro-N-acetylmuramic acid kinase [Pseudomonadota bacterium]
MIEVATGKPIWAIGVMTGTSMDGVDVALIRTDGETIDEFAGSVSYPVNSIRKDLIQLAMQHLANTRVKFLRAFKARKVCIWWLDGIDRELLEMTDYAIEGLLFQGGIGLGGPTKEPWISINERMEDIALGVHGQTVIHRPDEGFTLQLGMPRARYRVGSRKFTSVTDFRTADMEAGGQGAPLAPFYHFALAKHIGAVEPVVLLNIGGVANITWVDPSKEKPEMDGALMAFDTGPGNALINDWMFQRTGCLVMDVDGAAASTGRVHRDRLNTNSGQEYLRRPGPKSLDRNDFHGVLAGMDGLSVNDGAATLTQFTADCVAASVRHMPSAPTRWLVCGGGRLNKTMMSMLADRLDAPVDPVEAVGLDGDMLEAQAFAYLAVRVLRGLPTSAPSTTGCREPVCGGRISYPSG